MFGKNFDKSSFVIVWFFLLVSGEVELHVIGSVFIFSACKKNFLVPKNLSSLIKTTKQT